MKIVQLKGGLGNQIFQYVFAKRIEIEENEKVFLDDSFYDTKFQDKCYARIAQPRIYNFRLSIPTLKVNSFYRGGARKNRIWHILKKLRLLKMFCEYPPAIPIYDDIKGCKIFDGYFGLWHFVDKVWSDVKNDLVPAKEISEKSQKMIDQVQQENSVFVGVRRGDYVKYQDIYGSYPQEYYDYGLKYIQSRTGDVKVYVFSDDIEWVKENMNFQKWGAIFRNDEDIVSDFEELMVMANCKHAVIANSTFNWWGARLNYYDGKIVVAPKKWFANGWKEEIIPPYWIKMNNEGEIG